MERHWGPPAVIFSVTVLCSLALPVHAQMLSCLPGQDCPSIPSDVNLTKEDYMRSVLKNWTSSQVSAWQSLDAPYRDWVASLMWNREQMREIEQRTGKPVTTHYDPYNRLDVPVSCIPSNFVPPTHNPSDPSFRGNIHTYLTHTVTVGPLASLGGTEVDLDDWPQWEGVEPNFRIQAEKEMYEVHYRLLWVQARLAWWQSNEAMLQKCVEDNRVRQLSQLQIFALNSDVEDEDKKRESEYERLKEKVLKAFAPRQVKEEKAKELDDYQLIDKYEADMNRSEKADHSEKASPSPSEKASPSPSPHETHDILH